MFASTLKSLRTLHKLTQKEFAAKFNLTQQAIGKWESGISTPDYETLGKIADYFDVSVDYLIGHEKKPTVKDSEPSKKEILYRAYLAAAPGTQAAVCKLLDLPSESVTENLA